jgi:SAM-dependent methyltransferase
MKVRESGMPVESMWAGFFDPLGALERLGLTLGTTIAVDLGCGYGTFTIPAARLILGTVHGFDIEPEMIRAVEAKARDAGLANVETHLRDFVAEGTGLPDASAGYVLLFNVLHAEDPRRLLREAHRILVPGGLAGVMHWVSDRPTPRGPSLDIRPKPLDCLEWLAAEGFAAEAPIDLPPTTSGSWPGSGSRVGMRTSGSGFQCGSRNR